MTIIYDHAGGGGCIHMIDNTCLRVHAPPHDPQAWAQVKKDMAIYASPFMRPA